MQKEEIDVKKLYLSVKYNQIFFNNKIIKNKKFLLILGWFGIRKDFCHFLLSLCPLLQEYGNISYQPRSEQDQPPSEPMVSEKNEKYVKKIDLTKPVVPIISIDMPD